MPVYFVQPVEGGPVKIGYTADVPKRVKELGYRYGKPLALLATMPGGKTEEKAVHERFSHLRLDAAGGNVRTEQFRPESDLMEFIGKPLLVGANPGAAEAMKMAGGMVDLRLRINEDMHREIQDVAAEEGLMVAGYVRSLIVKDLKQRKKGAAE